MKRIRLAILAAALAAPATAQAADRPSNDPSFTQDVHTAPLPEGNLEWQRLQLYPTPLWFLSQILPNPELAFGRHELVGPAEQRESDSSPSFGLRWELTPVLWSFGVHRKQSPWRLLIVDPIARVSGSLELVGTFEYIAGHVDKVLARPGLRVNLPIIANGESLSVALGTSAYSYNDQLRVAYDAGAYILAGRLGIQVTAAPTHSPLAAITTLRLRLF